MLVAATFLLLCAGICQAAFVRVEWRYWNFILPFSVVTAIVIWPDCHPSSSGLRLYSVFNGVDKHYELWKTGPRPVPPQYGIVMETLPSDAIVMTQVPWEFSFHTRLKSVILPYDDDDQEVLRLAARYKIQYLVLMRASNLSAISTTTIWQTASFLSGWTVSTTTETSQSDSFVAMH